jgi:hypothetical protein
MSQNKMGGGSQAITGLAIKDRMNHPFLLANGIYVFQHTTTDQTNQESVVRETVMALYDIIPDMWEDDEFSKDIARAETRQTVDVRPEFCDQKATVEWCETHGIPAVQSVVVYNHHLIMKACINLLDRRGLLTKKIFKEIFTGRRFEKKPGAAADMAHIVEEVFKDSGQT